MHEKVLLIAKAGEIRGVDLDAPHHHTIPTVSGLLVAPSAVNFYAANYTLYWADTDVNTINSLYFCVHVCSY